MIWHPERIAELMLEAGDIAMDFYHRAEVSFKSDRSMVTEADLAIEALFARHFDRPRDGVYLIGEETHAQQSEGYIEAALRHSAYVADPIDGTANYANHLDLWGISLGLMEDSVLQDGCTYFPTSGELLITAGRDVLLRKVAGGHCGAPEKVNFARGLGRDSGMVALTQKIAKVGRFAKRNPVHALASAVFPLAGLVRGRYFAYLGQLKLWDIAGGVPMAERAGLDMFLMDGTPFDTRVDSRLYRLDPDDGKRWALKDILVVAQPGHRDYFTRDIALGNS